MSTARRTTHDRIEASAGPPRGRLSWGAVLAGTLVALMVMLLVNLLALGFGLQSIDPAAEQDPFAGAGAGTLTGVIVANVLALFAGGWTAARLADRPNGGDAALHGILTWGLLTLASLWLLTSAIGTLVGGVAGIVGQGLSTVGQGIGAVAPEAAQAVEDALADQGTSVDGILQELEGLADPDADAAQGEVATLVERYVTQGEEVDRQEVVAALAASTELSEEEADERLTAWEERADEAAQALAEARGQLEEAAQRASDAVGASALWAAVGLVLGAVVAIVGSLVGRPRRTTASPEFG